MLRTRCFEVSGSSVPLAVVCLGSISVIVDHITSHRATKPHSILQKVSTAAVLVVRHIYIFFFIQTARLGITFFRLN